MTTSSSQVIAWVDLVAELLRKPGGAHDRAQLFDMLECTFEGRPSWNEVSADGTLAFESPRMPQQWPGWDEYTWWHQNGATVHPLIRWYGTSGDFAAMTMGRVPARLLESSAASRARERLRLLDLDQQLSIPCRVGPEGSSAFVMARSGEDFSDHHLSLARAVQPLLILMARQDRVEPSAVSDPFGLTGRERAVLRLLCEGGTAVAIARRLGTSPRTVNKHLEHVYRKLGVRDRLQAYRVAVMSGLVPREADASDVD